MEDFVPIEIQGLLLALDELGRSFGCNRDLYYTLGEYFGYTKAFLFLLNNHRQILWHGFRVPSVPKHRTLLVLFMILKIIFIIMVTLMPSSTLSKQQDILQF